MSPLPARWSLPAGVTRLSTPFPPPRSRSLARLAFALCRPAPSRGSAVSLIPSFPTTNRERKIEPLSLPFFVSSSPSLSLSPPYDVPLPFPLHESFSPAPPPRVNLDHPLSRNSGCLSLSFSLFLTRSLAFLSPFCSSLYTECPFPSISLYPISLTYTSPFVPLFFIPQKKISPLSTSLFSLDSLFALSFPPYFVIVLVSFFFSLSFLLPIVNLSPPSFSCQSLFLFS